jgi:hypothetical protein
VPEETDIKKQALNHLASVLLDPETATGLVTAVAIGSPPNIEADLTVFIDPAAAPCEEAGIRASAQQLAGSLTVHILRCGPFEGLAAGLGDSIAALDLYRYNIPPVSAGTFGATVASSGRWYLLSSNHVLANNRQAPTRTNVYEQGPIDDIGSQIAALTGSVLLIDPPNPNQPNQADCAWAELVSPPAPLPTPQQRVTPVDASLGMQVTKTGRTTGQTTSTIRFPQLCAWIDFGFGTYYFTGQVGTWDAAVPPPPSGPPFVPPGFAAPGDSGSLVTTAPATTPPQGVGLVCARGYAYDPNGEFQAYIVLTCPLSAVISGMEANNLTAPVIYAV